MECPPVIFYLAAEVVLGVIDVVLGRLRVRVVTLFALLLAAAVDLAAWGILGVWGILGAWGRHLEGGGG